MSQDKDIPKPASEEELEEAIAKSCDSGPKPWGYLLVTSHDHNLSPKELELKEWAASNGPRKTTTSMARKTV